MQAWTTGLGDLGDALACILVKHQVHATPPLGKGSQPAPGASTFPDRLFPEKSYFLLSAQRPARCQRRLRFMMRRRLKKRNKRLGNKEEHARSCTLLVRRRQPMEMLTHFHESFFQSDIH